MATCNLSAPNYFHQIIRPHIAVPLLQLANGSQGMLPHSRLHQEQPRSLDGPDLLYTPP